jgi:uncharacterized protein YecE (DUF72 family)
MSRNSRRQFARISCPTSRRFISFGLTGEIGRGGHHEHKGELYNYLYTAPEIEEFGETLKAVEKIVKKYAYMDNHANAQAVVNALELKDFLGQPIHEDFNPELIKRFPELKKILSVATRQDVLVPAPKS